MSGITTDLKQLWSEYAQGMQTRIDEIGIDAFTLELVDQAENKHLAEAITKCEAMGHSRPFMSRIMSVEEVESVDVGDVKVQMKPVTIEEMHRIVGEMVAKSANPRMIEIAADLIYKSVVGIGPRTRPDARPDSTNRKARRRSESLARRAAS